MIAGLVLAAGRGERFGGYKLLQMIAGRPLVCHTVAHVLASALDAVVVVVGPGGDNVETAIRAHFPGEPRMSFVQNPDAMRGQATSLKAGLRAMPAHVTLALVQLADMPLVSAAIIDWLLDAARERNEMVVPVCGGRWRNPRVIPARYFADFLALDDGTRGQTVFETRKADVVEVHVGEAWNFIDVDTPDDLAMVEHVLQGG